MSPVSDPVPLVHIPPPDQVGNALNGTTQNRTTQNRPLRIGTLAAGLGSLLALSLGTWWLVQPERHALVADLDPLSLPASLPGTVSSLLLVALGSIGLITVGVLWRTRTRRTAAIGRLLTVGVLVECLGLLILSSDPTLLMELGYLMAALLPIAFVTVGVLVCRKSVTMRWIFAALIIAAAGWAIITPSITLTTVPGLIRDLLSMLIRLPLAKLLLPLFALTAVGWGLLARGLLNDTVVAARVGTLVARIGVVATWIAAAGPIPYFLVRLTWLTPWPQFAPATLTGDYRLWGILLGSGGLVGTILTIGLLGRWGRIFPSWTPVVGGRRVPVPMAVVPATIVGLALLLACGPMIAAAARHGAGSLIETLIVFPFWIWGPALLIATWAYALRRRQEPVDAR